MSALLRQFRRAPGRITASVFALALAVGAIGVLAIPTVSGGTLHQAVERDGLADIVVATSPLDADQIAGVGRLDNVEAAEGQAVAAIRLGDGFQTRLIGLDIDHQTMDRLHLDAGRLPAAADEVVTTPALGAIGERLAIDGDSLTIVGHGSTLWWSGNDVVFARYDAVAERTHGANRLVVTAADDSESALRATSRAIRAELARDGATYAAFPTFLPDGTTPVDADIQQVSTLIGLLGIFAGGIALVLLAGTTNTLITERTREVAVMRALGGRRRPLRRRLRRIAVGITVVALAIGLPLGVVISNVIARMVLQEFVGVTPDVAVDWRVLVGSALGALLGARLVAARAARRVTGLPLAEALRDREGTPFGSSRLQRLAARLPFGGIAGRMAARNSFRRPTRTVAVVAQIGAAVGAAFLIPSLATSVNEFNTASRTPWTWETVSVARDPGLPLVATDRQTDDPTEETGIWSEGEIVGWQVDVYGVEPDTAYFAAGVVDGRWFGPDGREAVVSAGFADRTEVSVGDDVEVELASGPVVYTVVGTVDDHARTLYTDRSVLATDLGAPGMANVVWTSDPSPVLSGDVAMRTNTAEQLAADDAAGRDAIVLIFGAIGVIVAGVAALAVLSSMTVDLFERRHELAALQAVGARRRRIRGLLVRELAPIGLAGTVLGLAVGAAGTRGIIGSFEASNAVDIGVVDATAAIPWVVAGAALMLVLLAAAVARSSGRRPIAVTLRGAA